MFEVVRQPTEARAEGPSDLRNDIGPRTDGGDKGGKTDGLIRGRDCKGRVGSTVGVSGDIGASTTHRRSTGEAGGFSGPTEVSTPGCRSRPVGLGPGQGDRGETATLAWQRSARSDRRRSERPLM